MLCGGHHRKRSVKRLIAYFMAGLESDAANQAEGCIKNKRDRSY